MVSLLAYFCDHRSLCSILLLYRNKIRFSFLTFRLLKTHKTCNFSFPQYHIPKKNMYSWLGLNIVSSFETSCSLPVPNSRTLINMPLGSLLYKQVKVHECNLQCISASLFMIMIILIMIINSQHTWTWSWWIFKFKTVDCVIITFNLKCNPQLYMQNHNLFKKLNSLFNCSPASYLWQGSKQYFNFYSIPNAMKLY